MRHQNSFPLSDFVFLLVRKLNPTHNGLRRFASCSNRIVTYCCALPLRSLHFCYTNLPTILIDSPPHVPTIAIRVSKVIVTQHVNRGERYVLESSFDLITWTVAGPSFIAASDTIEDEFDINLSGRFFRVRRVAAP